MEEQILESMAWRYESPLWEYLKSSDKSVPSCEQVSLPSQLGVPATPVCESAAKSTPAPPPPQVPYSPSTYVSTKRAESSLATCKELVLFSYFYCDCSRSFSLNLFFLIVFRGSSSTITGVFSLVVDGSHSVAELETSTVSRSAAGGTGSHSFGEHYAARIRSYDKG